MEEKKYILTDETMEFEGHTLHRIQAVKYVAPNILPGTLGGFVEAEDNLSQKGRCWIFENSKVMDEVIINDNAHVHQSIVRDYAIVHDDAIVIDCVIRDSVRIANHAILRNCLARGDFDLIGESAIIGPEKGRPTLIESPLDFLVIGPIGSRNDYTTFYRSGNDIYVVCGCFNETIDRFAEKVSWKHKGTKFGKEYDAAIMLAKCKLGQRG